MFIFNVHGVPSVQKQTKFFRCGDGVRTYDPSAKDKEYIQWQVRPFMGESPLACAIEMFITFFLPIPKSTSGIRRKQMENRVILPVKRPDIDNLAYIVTNALKGIVYQDDSQVCSMHLYKFYDKDPRTVIKVRPILQLEQGLNEQKEQPTVEE